MNKFLNSFVSVFSVSFLQEHTEKFRKYVAERNYHMMTVEEYGKILESVGFKNVSFFTLKTTTWWLWRSTARSWSLLALKM